MSSLWNQFECLACKAAHISHFGCLFEKFLANSELFRYVYSHSIFLLFVPLILGYYIVIYLLNSVFCSYEFLYLLQLLCNKYCVDIKAVFFHQLLSHTKSTVQSICSLLFGHKLFKKFPNSNAYGIENIVAKFEDYYKLNISIQTIKQMKYYKLLYHYI